MLADPATAPISDKLRVTLAFLKKVTRAHGDVNVDDVKVLLAAGVSRQAIEDALGVCFAFNVITRLADAFEFHVGPRAEFDASAKSLLTRGYKV